MTPKEILQMAADVLLTEPALGAGMTDYGDSTESILTFAYLIVKAERAELIRLADSCGYVSIETLERRGSSQPKEEKVTHTLGPWEITEEDFGDELWFGGSGEGLIEVHGWVNGGCKRSYPKAWARLQADAKLIAAAPDLLEALKAMLEYTADLNPTQGFDESDHAAVKQAGTAIAKAT